MLVLSADSSQQSCSVALSTHNQLLHFLECAIPNKQAEQLPLLVQQVLSDQDLTLDQIELLAVSIGPGSFTGVRTGLSMWKAMALVLQVPCVGVTTLEMLAYSPASPSPHPIKVLVNARRDEYYYQNFAWCDGELKATNEATLLHKSALAPHLTSGAPIVTNDPELQGHGIEFTSLDARQVAHAAWYLRHQASSLVPLYIRSADAKLPTTPPLL